MSTILAERKRFNYNVGPIHSTRSSHSQKKININPIIPASHVKDENAQTIKVSDIKDTSKKIQELEAINRKILEDTTQQFKKLEFDVQRVEKILEEKQAQVIDLENDKKGLQQSLNRANEEKNILIEAIFQKDLVIKEFQAKINEFLRGQAQASIQPKKIVIQTSETQIQTDPLVENNLKNQLNAYASKNRQLQNQLYEAKQELFDAQNKVKLLTQQFEAYKILKQIESVQEI